MKYGFTQNDHIHNKYISNLYEVYFITIKIFC